MRIELAPLEGVTVALYRRTYHECFPACDRYYTPFLTPTQDHKITGRMWSEIDPARNEGMNLIPQLLTNQADLFVWAAGELKALGYREVNLNLGCPSGTVVKKKRGSGLLGQRELLEPMLDEIFAHCPIAVSIKTRVGLRSEEELPALLELFGRYPMASLIVHPRIQSDGYRGDIRMEAFAKVMEVIRVPVCYNGDLFRPEDAVAVKAAYPGLSALMLGRGAVANPGLPGYLKTGVWATLPQVREFYGLLYERVCAAMPGRRPTIFKMRELWSYLACMFEHPERPLKRIRHADTLPAFEAAAEELFQTCRFLPDASFYYL